MKRIYTAPNAFMTEVVKGLKPGRALEVGMGQGRNSVYLAKLGWNVTGFDISERGIEVAQKSAQAAGVKIRTIRSSMEDFDYGAGQWDLVVGTYVGASWREKAVGGLKPGGVVVVEAFFNPAKAATGAGFGPNDRDTRFRQSRRAAGSGFRGPSGQRSDARLDGRLLGQFQRAGDGRGHG